MKRNAFHTVGVDFMGPFTPFKVLTARRPSRKKKYPTGEEEPEVHSGKVWILVVSCTLTQAMILRVVEGVGVKYFRAAINNLCFDYMIKPHTMVSDRADTFKATYLRTLYAQRQFLNQDEYLCGGSALPQGAYVETAMSYNGLLTSNQQTVRESVYSSLQKL